MGLVGGSEGKEKTLGNLKIPLDFCVAIIYNMVTQNEGGEQMGKIGRPTADPKTHQLRIRLSEADNRKLNDCAERLEISRSDVIRRGIDKVYKEGGNENG